MYKPFKLVRLPKHAGPDQQGDMFCVGAIGNKEHIKGGESGEIALINGATGSDTKATRIVQEKVVDALNAVWNQYMDGRFHEDRGFQCSWMAKGHTVSFERLKELIAETGVQSSGNPLETAYKLKVGERFDFGDWEIERTS